MKKAILAVSFGTSYPDTLEKTIAATERELAAAYPEWEVRRAFTSGMIIKKLRQRDGLEIDNVGEALHRLEADGFTHVAVQPTHVMHGEEYEKMLAQLEPYRLRMQIAVGMPMLHAEADYAAVADALLEWLSEPKADEALVFMGHGTPHFANSAYSQMEHVLKSRCDRIYMATVEGYPTLESVKRQLEGRPEIKKVTLAAFMLVAGDHARNDMAGSEDSWKAELEADGYSVRCVLQGLGECRKIRELFVEHCREAVEELSRCGKLWGVGVGPGDPELMTMKAVRVLREADVVMVPDTSKSDKTALNIAKDYLDGSKELIFVKTPMVRDKAVVDAAYDDAARQICALLDQGKQVAFLTLGDPTVYSTYMYIHEKVMCQGYTVEVVPGVTSFCAAAARLNISLCQGSEPLLVIPASHNPEALMDVPANKVFMKAGSSILELQKSLAEHGMLENAAMVENCSMPNERLFPKFKELNETSGYFSLVIAKGGKS
ncbi:MAG: precorrin-2 C(20)-methyltransferase [Clostridiales bacterium]|nr:precorrin-2 C(20)-methyltransferase [Clostridiales bacterium]